MSAVIKKLGRKRAHRDHTLRNLATSVILYERVDTTVAKGKVVKSLVDRWISKAKQNSLAARRQLLSQAFDKNAVKKMFEVLVDRYENRQSGFVKMVRLGERLGDGSMMVRLELMDREEPSKESTQPKGGDEVADTDKPVKRVKKKELHAT